jgi:hypothetical protein
MTKASIPRIIEEKAQRNRQTATKMLSRRITGNKNIFNSILMRNLLADWVFLFTAKS